MSAKLIDRDLGWSEFFKNVSKMDDARVRVGLLDDGEEYPEGGISVAEVGAINEFGTENGHIPSRSFIRSTFDDKRAELVALAEMLTQRILFGKSTVDDAMGLLGATLANAIKMTIRNSGPGLDGEQWDRNAESTARAKAAIGKTAKFFKRPARNLGEALAQAGALAAVKPLIDTSRLLNSITWAVET